MALALLIRMGGAVNRSLRTIYMCHFQQLQSSAWHHPFRGKEAVRLNILKTLLKPHRKALGIGLLAVIGESVAGLLQPWPLKIVFDDVLKAKASVGHGWLNNFIHSVAGTDPLSILRFAAVASLVIALADAVCSYTETYLTTSVGQWVMHDLRRTLYSHIQRLSLAYHDQKRLAT